MNSLRPGNQRGHVDRGRLDSCCTISFGNYHDARPVGFRGLRVRSADRVVAGAAPGGESTVRLAAAAPADALLFDRDWERRAAGGNDPMRKRTRS
jgi:hypothetical protein